MNQVVSAVKKNLDLSQNRPIKEAIYEALRKTILLGEIPSGERINEKNLSENLNISRTPIRYALERLDEEDLLNAKRVLVYLSKVFQLTMPMKFLTFARNWMCLPRVRPCV